MEQLEKNLNRDLDLTINTMKELFENINRSYIKLSENFEGLMRNVQSNLDLLNATKKELSLQGVEKSHGLDSSIQETHAKIQSKFSQIDMNINAIQDSFINIDELLAPKKAEAD